MIRILSALQLILLAVTSNASTITVTNTNDAGVGSLRNAVLVANTNSGVDSIDFDPTINGVAIYVQTGSMEITEELVIQGNNAANTLIIGDSTGIIFDIADSIPVAIRGLNISNAGIAINTAHPAGNLTVIDCELSFFTGYQAIYYSSNTGNLLVDKCYIHDNANGVWTQDSYNYTVTNSTFANNYTSGAILMAGGFSGDGYFANNTVYGNNYGIWVLDPQAGHTVVIANNTCIGNTNNGIYINEQNDNGALVTMVNNIAYGNGQDFVLDNMFGFAGANPVNIKNMVGTCNSSHGCPTWYSSADPLLDTTAFTNSGVQTPIFSINCNSPAYNAGSDATAGVSALDQRGLNRYAATDIGAYEFQPAASIVIETACFSYTSPGGNFVWTTSGIYADTLTAVDGCDSVVTVNLTVNTVNTTVADSVTELIAQEDSAAYIWLNCDAGYAAITGETAVSFAPTIAGNYAVEITKNGCVDTSACFSITPVAIAESRFATVVSVYPNPGNGAVQINLGGEYQQVVVTVKNTLGQTVVSKTYPAAESIPLEITGEAGIYLLEIRAAGNKTAAIRLVKQ